MNIIVLVKLTALIIAMQKMGIFSVQGLTNLSSRLKNDMKDVEHVKIYRIKNTG